MPNGTPWTTEEAATARRMAAEGHGFPAIAEALGRSRKSVQSWAHANGVKTGKGQPWTAREVARAHTLYRAGNTCAEVARILGRSENSVTHRLWRDDVTSQARSGWWRTDMHATRYALAREGLTAAEVIAVLGLTCAPVSLRSWMARYCAKANMPRPWRTNRGRGRTFRAELVEIKRAALGLTPKVTPR
jgi:DNA-binding CsgD family transcriptional regulator